MLGSLSHIDKDWVRLSVIKFSTLFEKTVHANFHKSFTLIFYNNIATLRFYPVHVLRGRPSFFMIFMISLFICSEQMLSIAGCTFVFFFLSSFLSFFLSSPLSLHFTHYFSRPYTFSLFHRKSAIFLPFLWKMHSSNT